MTDSGAERHPAAPAPQAEVCAWFDAEKGRRCGRQRDDKIHAKYGNDLHNDWMHVFEVGAAPAETARPGHIAMNRDGTEGARSTPDMPKGHVIGETAGEMTAEQEAFKWLCEQPRPIGVIDVPRLLAAFAKQRVEQAERDAKRERDIIREAANGLARLFESSERKVADLEREREYTLGYEGKQHFAMWDMQRKRAEAAESELREMREALADWKASVDLHIERLNAMDVDKFTNGRAGELQIERRVSDTLARLLARKAGS